MQETYVPLDTSDWGPSEQPLAAVDEFGMRGMHSVGHAASFGFGGHAAGLAMVREDWDVALDLADRFVALEHGEVVRSSDAAAARDDPRSLRRALGLA